MKPGTAVEHGLIAAIIGAKRSGHSLNDRFQKVANALNKAAPK